MIAGPLATRVFWAGPFLDKLAPDDAADREAEARAIDRRRAEAHLCVLCGAPAGWAVVYRPPSIQADRDPRYVDLCAGHLAGIRDETCPKLAAGLYGRTGHASPPPDIINIAGPCRVPRRD